MNTEEILKLSQLARIDMSNAETEEFAKDMSSILDYVGQINNEVGKNEGPEIGDVYNVMREDIDAHESGVYTEELLKATDRTENGYFKVKKIL